MNSLFASIGSYFGFLTSGAPVATPTTQEDGSVVTQMVVSPTQYVTPDVREEYVLTGSVTLAVSAADSDQFFDFPLANIVFNPPLTAFTVSKIQSVVVRCPTIPHDANWYVGIWATLPALVNGVARQSRSVAHRAPNKMFVWRSNITVVQTVEHEIPWPVGFAISDSLHATLPGIHPASLQFGLNNQPSGTATGIPAGNYVFDVLVKVHVAGRGLFGTI